MNTLIPRKDITGDGVIYLKAGKSYRVKSKEESTESNKAKVVVNSEIKGIELLIEVDKQSLKRTKTWEILRS